MTGVGIYGPLPSPATFVEFYLRLHQKLVIPASVFDSSWACQVRHLGDSLRWSKNVFIHPKNVELGAPLFASFLDRLILLPPQGCQKLLCTTILLARREAFRHCIDGGKVRALQAALGASTVTAILKTTTIYENPLNSSDWRLESLLAEAFSHIERVCSGSRQTVLGAIKIALPREMPVIQSDYSELGFEKLLRDACSLHSELTWLFG